MKNGILFLLILASCNPITKEKEDNTLRLAFTSEVTTLDPAVGYDINSSTVIQECHESLYQYHYLKRPYEPTTLLAEDMPITSRDGKIVKIRIKKNIRYAPHPALAKNRYVTSYDFINQIKRLAFAPIKSRGSWMFEDNLIGFKEFTKAAGDSLEKFFSLSIKGVEAPDSQTLIFHFSKPSPLFIHALTMNFIVPVPEELIRVTDNKLENICLGTGPYMLASFERDRKLVLVKNPNFHDEKFPSSGNHLAGAQNLLLDADAKLPFIKQISIYIMKNQDERWKAFLDHKIDTISLTSPKHYAAVLNDDGELKEELQKKGFSLQVSPSLTFWWLAINMQDPFLSKNKAVRFAIAHAINIEEYIKTFTTPISLKANSLYTPGIPGYDPDSKLPFIYSPELAKEILAKAGFKNGRGIPTLTFAYRKSTDSTGADKANFIMKALKEIGIEVKAIPLSYLELQEYKSRKALQIWQEGWTLDYPDAENILQQLVSRNRSPGPNTTGYASNEFDREFEKFALLSNSPEKFKAMKKLEEIVNKDLPWIMFHYSRNYQLINSRLKNYHSSDIILNPYKYWRIEKQ